MPNFISGRLSIPNNNRSRYRYQVKSPHASLVYKYGASQNNSPYASFTNGNETAIPRITNRGQAVGGKFAPSARKRVRHLKGGTGDTIASKLRGGMGATRPNFGQHGRSSPIPPLKY